MDFSCKELQTDVLQIQDKAGNCSTLVTGSERALLFDTMIGLGDLKRFVEARTKLPLIVVNSHGHMDHMGGNFQFEKVYLHPRDFSLIPIDLENVTVRGEHMGVCLENCRRSLENTGNICALEEGTEFDLGNLKVKVLALPGHTGGSIGLLLPEKRLLLAGDACTPQMCLYMDGSESLEVYRETLRKLEKEPFDSFVLGHFMKLFQKDF